MTEWVRTNWQWVFVNLSGLIVMLTLVAQAEKAGDFHADFEPMLASGKWSIRFLLFSLTMTPLNMLFGWRGALKLRKPAGLWAFGFAALHFAFFLTDPRWRTVPFPINQTYIVLGVVALAILSAMAITSNRWAMKRMGRAWKRLHRLVYAVGFLVIAHALLAAVSSKKVLIFDPDVRFELAIYLLALLIILAPRIPPLRRAGIRLRGRAAFGGFSRASKAR